IERPPFGADVQAIYARTLRRGRRAGHARSPGRRALYRRPHRGHGARPGSGLAPRGDDRAQYAPRRAALRAHPRRALGRLSLDRRIQPPRPDQAHPARGRPRLHGRGRRRRLEGPLGAGLVRDPAALRQPPDTASCVALDAVARKRAAVAPPRVCGAAGRVAPMSPWKTLFRYIARQFFTWCTIIFVAMMSIVFLLDYIELIRRAGTRPDATLLILLEMAALKQPDMMQQVMPFAILFGTMMAFWRLTRSHELVVARAAGISAWQFLAPPLSGAFLLGV